jgi:hypothetical protein
VGSPGWLVSDGAGGLGHASLGGSWPFVGWVLLAVGASFFVGQTWTTFLFIGLAATAILAAGTGAFARETMLAVVGACALVVLAIVVRSISDDLSSYEFGRRQAAVIGGLVAMGVFWFGGVVVSAAPGARVRGLPSVESPSSDTGVVLWLTSTSGGARSWTTRGFSHDLGSLPPPAGPAERLVTRGVEAVRDDRTHRLGGILALADVSHIVALDTDSGRGLDGQADLAPQESQAGAVVYRNEAWRGPVMLLAAAPSAPLDPQGLADVVRDPRRVPVKGWPSGRIVVDPPASADRSMQQVLYVASGVRGGTHIEAGRGRIAAAGAYVSATGLDEPLRIEPPGRLWRWILPIDLIALLALLVVWFLSAYAGGPALPLSELVADLEPLSLPVAWLAAVPAGLVLSVALGWFGPLWGVGGPFLSSAWYCPPIGHEYAQSIGIVNPHRDDVEFIVRPDLIARPTAEGSIPAESRTTLDIHSSDGAVVESYGRRLAVASQVSRLGDRDASLCARFTREMNIFPEGGRFATRAQPRLFERYIVYNPFPDLARASVRFFSPEETIAPPDLQDILVKPGSFVLVDPEREFEPMPNLSTVVRIWQGRALVARRLRTVEQVSWSLPSQPASSGVLPRAQTERAHTSLIAVNTSEDPARISVFGAGRRGSIPEESFTVVGGGRNTLDLGDVAPRAGDLVVELSSDRPVAIESLVAPDDRRRGVSLMPPLEPDRAWVLPIAERRELVVVNPNPRAIEVEVERLGPGPPIESFTVEASRTRRIKLEGGRGFGLIVRSRAVFTAAVVGGRGSTTGVPLA